MDGLATLILAAVLGGTPLPLQAPDHPCSDELPSVHLDVEWSSLEIAPSQAALAVEAMVDDAMYVSPSGWLGIAVNGDLALLLDVRVDRLDTSPDPARPEARNAIAARIGIEIRPSVLIPL